MKAARTIFFLIAFSILSLQTGCTVALWKETGHWDACKTPAQPNHLQVFEDTRREDFLVIFEQLSERSDSVRERAYYLYSSEGTIQQRKRPHFVSVHRAKALKRIPVLTSTNSLPQDKPFVVAAKDDYVFKLYLKDGATSSYMLPVYSDNIGQAERIALTPVAIAVDATIVGSIIILEAAAHSNWSTEGP